MEYNKVLYTAGYLFLILISFRKLDICRDDLESGISQIRFHRSRWNFST